MNKLIEFSNELITSFNNTLPRKQRGNLRMIAHKWVNKLPLNKREKETLVKYQKFCLEYFMDKGMK